SCGVSWYGSPEPSRPDGSGEPYHEGSDGSGEPYHQAPPAGSPFASPSPIRRVPRENPRCGPGHRGPRPAVHYGPGQAGPPEEEGGGKEAAGAARPADRGQLPLRPPRATGLRFLASQGRDADAAGAVDPRRRLARRRQERLLRLGEEVPR